MLPAVLVSILASAAVVVAIREYRAGTERLRAEQSERAEELIDQLQKSVTSIESLARYAVAMYVPEEPHDPDALVDLSARLLPLVPQVFSIVWAPATNVGDVPGVLERIGRSLPVAPLPTHQIADLRPDEPRFLVLDIHPRTQQNLLSRGLVLNAIQGPGQAIRGALSSGSVRATGPLNLVQLPDEPALVIYGPVIGKTGSVVGVLGFSFRFASIMPPERPPGISLAAYDRAAPEFGAVYRFGDVATGAISRPVAFAGRTYDVSVSVASPSDADPFVRSILIALFGLGGALIAGLVSNRLAETNRRLQMSLTAQRVAEDQLRIVLRELSHRIGNLLGLVQGIARQTFTVDRTTSEGIRLFEGRLQALAQSGRLASAGHSEGDLRDLAKAVIDGFGDRIKWQGPSLMLGNASGQLLPLVLHELATNATKYGGLAAREGYVDLKWSADDDELILEWQEYAGPTNAPSSRKGFGSRLLGEIVPMQLGGTAERSFTDNGFRYVLRVPTVCLSR